MILPILGKRIIPQDPTPHTPENVDLHPTPPYTPGPGSRARAPGAAWSLVPAQEDVCKTFRRQFCVCKILCVPLRPNARVSKTHVLDAFCTLFTRVCAPLRWNEGVSKKCVKHIRV